MPGLLKTLVRLLSYKEPQNEELGFELLESANEGKNIEKPPSEATPSPVPKEKKESGKGPFTVAEWNENKKTENPEKTCAPENQSDTIAAELCVNLETIRQKFLMPRNQDLILREFKIGRRAKAFMAYIEGMVDRNTVNLSILPSLMDKDVLQELGNECAVDFLMENVLTVHSLKKTDKYSDAVMHILNGVSVLFIEGCSECILIETRGYEKRSVEKPITETVVKGSQEGFTEDLRTNITLIRRIIKNEKLIAETLMVGNTNHANCAIIYLDGVANPQVINEVKKRIKRVSTDFILGDGMLEQFIEDNSMMLFPQTLTTERPDRSASFIMEGQVVIISEGSPFAITVPVTFFRLFHTSEDTNVRWPLGSFLRLIRLFGLFCATLLPAIYIAITLYHVEMIPTELLTSIAKAKETVPFPTLIEVLIMEISFELIREGGIRVPSVIGQTLGIVGALILGQAAVSAGIISPILVIIVSVTGLGSFAIPNYTLALAIRVERFLFIFAAAALGFYGIALLLALLAILSCSMKSFGVPFFAPVAPRTKINQDVILRYPIWTQNKRPDTLNSPNRNRQGKNQKVWASEKVNDNKNKGDPS